MDIKVLTEILTDLSQMIELNIFMSLKIFLDEVLPKAETPEQKLDLFKYWVDLNVAKLEECKEKTTSATK